jgi:hypothetical protein
MNVIDGRLSRNLPDRKVGHFGFAGPYFLDLSINIRRRQQHHHYHRHHIKSI